MPGTKRLRLAKSFDGPALWFPAPKTLTRAVKTKYDETR